MEKIKQPYFLNPNTVFLAKNLIGKVLCTNINNKICKAIICETEAYCGITDKACHAYNNRYTNRTKTMYQKGGVAYVYLCYGIHYLFNIVTHHENEPHAILIRSVLPLSGISYMLERKNRETYHPKIGVGPGNVSKILGLNLSHNNLPVYENIIWLEKHFANPNSTNIKATPRIGVDYAGEDAKLLYRFYINSTHLKNN